jgi:hypothetical protein
MTTILADVRFGVMVAESNISDGDRVWFGPKVRRVKGALVGLAGNVDEATWFLDWWKRGMPNERHRFSHSNALVLTSTGLLSFNYTCVPETIKGGREAIGTGAKAAMCAYEALGFADPKKAVQIVCKHDAGSRGPVRVYRL